jgi:hypothetical protein
MSNIILTTDLNEIMQPVEKVDSELITNIPANSEYKNFILVGEPGSKKVVNSCSDRYELVPLNEFAPAIRQIIIDKGLNFTEKYKMVNNAVFYGEIIIKDSDFYIGDNSNDKLQMKLMWSHSYNGLEQYELSLGTFQRVLCTNGLWMNVFDTKKYGLSITGKHTVKIQQSLSQLQTKLETVLNGDVKEKFKETFTPLYEHWVSDMDDRLLEVLKAAKIGTIKNNIEIIKNTIRDESNILYGGKVNDWLIYNGINKFLFDDNNNVALNSSRRKIDNKVLEKLLATV